MTFVADAAISKLTEIALLVDGEVFVEPICKPVALSTSLRSVIDADSSEDNVMVRVFTFIPSVEPVERVKEPSLALFVPAIKLVLL
jgi:hypothetical protein